MDREKQIEEMASEIEIFWRDTCRIDFDKTAKALYQKGYRKQSEGEWISVYDRLPEAGKLVLCIWERGDDKQNYGFGRYQAHDVWYVSNEGMPCVTNWMPLPEPPKMKGGE
jgi:hypothetical protein